MQVFFFSWAFLCHPKGWHLPANTFVNYPPPKGGEFLVLPSTPSLA